MLGDVLNELLASVLHILDFDDAVLVAVEDPENPKLRRKLFEEHVLVPAAERLQGHDELLLDEVLEVLAQTLDHVPVFIQQVNLLLETHEDLGSKLVPRLFVPFVKYILDPVLTAHPLHRLPLKFLPRVPVVLHQTQGPLLEVLVALQKHFPLLEVLSLAHSLVTQLLEKYSQLRVAQSLRLVRIWQSVFLVV